MTPAIRTSGLTKRYGDATVVDGLDLEVGTGEVFGLLGPNGAGKTTTILMLLGLTEPTAGRMEVLGMDPRRHPLEVKRRVGYLPDAVGFYDNLTGRENLRFTATLNGLEDAEDSIADVLDRDALVKDPEVLILDEPTTAIDPEGVARMLDLIRRLATERNVTILLSSHLLNQVQAVCDRVAIFVAGRVVAQGAPHDLAATADGHARVEFRFDDDTGVAEILRETPSVDAVSRGRLPGSWIASVDTGSISETVSALSAKGVRLSGVRRIDDDLDAVYRRYFDDREEATT
jgi:ABC-2 type transport system ATP-binding protein